MVQWVSPYPGKIPLILALFSGIFAGISVHPYLCNANWISFIPVKFPLSRLLYCMKYLIQSVPMYFKGSIVEEINNALVLLHYAGMLITVIGRNCGLKQCGVGIA